MAVSFKFKGRNTLKAVKIKVKNRSPVGYKLTAWEGRLQNRVGKIIKNG